MEYKDIWDLETALKVLAHDTVDSELWAEAVKWLIFNGPDEIRRLLLDASSLATGTSFPQLQPSKVTADGQPYYDINDLAKALNITEAEIREFLKRQAAELKDLHILYHSNDVTVH